MTIETRCEESGYWSVYVDGRQHITDESYTVATSVAEALRHPDRWEPSEAYEVAGSIRRSLGLPADANGYVG